MLDDDTQLRAARKQFNAFIRREQPAQQRDEHGRFQSTADAPVDRSLDQGARGGTSVVRTTGSQFLHDLWRTR
jgi:hypothetical protein